MRLAAVVLVALAAGACASAPAPSADPAPASSVASAPSPAAAPAVPAPAEQAPQVVYALRFLPGPMWVKGKSPMEQPGIGAHIATMGEWELKGIVMCGGPFLDGTGGMAVLRVASMDEAQKLAKSDAGVVAGLFVPEVHPWLLVIAPPMPAAATAGKGER